MPAETTIRVRYAETDTMGIVYYANYLVYMEVARVEYLRQHGWAMAWVDRQVHMPVVSVTCRYTRPARLDDLLHIRSRVTERKRASFTFAYEVTHAETGELIATGETRHACWDPGGQKMIPIPDWLRAVIDQDLGSGA